MRYLTGASILALRKERTVQPGRKYLGLACDCHLSVELIGFVEFGTGMGLFEKVDDTAERY